MSEYNRARIKQLAQIANMTHECQKRVADKLKRVKLACMFLETKAKHLKALELLESMTKLLSESEEMIAVSIVQQENQIRFIETMADREHAPSSPGHANILSELKRDILTQQIIHNHKR